MCNSVFMTYSEILDTCDSQNVPHKQPTKYDRSNIIHHILHTHVTNKCLILLCLDKTLHLAISISGAGSQHDAE